MRIIKSAVMLLVLVILLLIPGCDFAREQIASIKMPRGTDLSFETIMFEYDRDIGHDFPAKIEVVGDKKTELTGINNWITAEVRSKILSVDFSRYFVLMALMGDMGNTSYGINVTRIWQNKKTVYIKADFIIPEPGTFNQQAITSPKHIVKVSKEKMPEFGEITFRLVDKFGREWATSSQVIPHYLK
jgi:hypothetical protein